jgi:predicted DsbA family dithiol-disulfide isomerase
MSRTVSIDVVSDVVCPWCYVGMKRLDKAIAAVPDIDVTVNWRPYQLDPSVPEQGMDRKAYMLAKFGSEQRIRQMHERIEGLGRDEGIEFRFDDIKVAANTLDAHRVIRWAGTAGEGVQHEVVRRLFDQNFVQGGNLNDPATLVAAAREAGMDASVVEALLPTDADKDAVRNEIATASRMGITGVPCFLFEGKYAVMGAQDAATLTDAIRQIADAKARGEASV